MDAPSDIELQKVEIDRLKALTERDKLDFEKAKFEADESKRQEELGKLRAERERAEYEAADLRIPFKERPAYRQMIFQGIASTTAVLALLASALSIKPILDANEANYKAAIALAKKEDADKAAASADAAAAASKAALDISTKGAAVAQSQLTAAQATLDTVKQKVVEAKNNAVLADVDGVLSAATDPNQDFTPLLNKSMERSSKANRQIITAHLESVADDDHRPLVIRTRLFAFLLRLPDAEGHIAKHELSKLRFKRNLLSLASNQDVFEGSQVVPFWTTLNQALGKSVVAEYACHAYRSLRRKPGSQVDLTFEEIAANSYYSSPACFQVAATYLAIQFPVGTYDQILILRDRGPASLGDVDMLFDKSQIHLPADLKLSGPPKSVVTYGDTSKDDYYDFSSETLSKRFPVFFNVFTEQSLSRFRTCSSAILAPLHDNVWMEDAELSQYCPVSSWPKDPNMPATPQPAR